MSRSSSPTSSTRRNSWFARPRFRENVDAYLLIGPWLIGFLVLAVLPMVGSALLAFSRWNLLNPPHFLGIANFQGMVNDDLFWTPLANTAYYTVIAVPLQLLAALLAAMAVNVRLRTVNIYRTLLYLPSITPSVASALLWTWIFNPDFGLANAFLEALHLPRSQWLYDPATAKPALHSDEHLGHRPTNDYLPGWPAERSGFPSRSRRHRRRELVESFPFGDPADALAGHLFQHDRWHYRLASGFQRVYIMTQGGPANATLFYVLYLYRKAWESLEMGYASALAWVLFLIILAFTLIQFRLGRAWVFYEGELRS